MSTSILPTAFPGWEIGYEFYAGYLATPAGTDQEESAGRYAALIREELAREFPGAEIVVICKPGTTGLGGGPWALEPDGQPADWGDIGEAFQCAMDRAEARLWGKWTPSDGRVALDAPAQGESHLRLTSAWRTVVA
jgi:hypothetical protein